MIEKKGYLFESLFDMYTELCKKNNVEPRIGLDKFLIALTETLAKAIHFKCFNNTFLGVAVPFCSPDEPELWVLIIPTVDKGEKVLGYLLGPRQVIDEEVAKFKKLHDESDEGKSNSFDGLDFFERD